MPFSPPEPTCLFLSFPPPLCSSSLCPMLNPLLCFGMHLLFPLASCVPSIHPSLSSFVYLPPLLSQLSFYYYKWAQGSPFLHPALIEKITLILNLPLAIVWPLTLLSQLDFFRASSHMLFLYFFSSVLCELPLFVFCFLHSTDVACLKLTVTFPLP